VDSLTEVLATIDARLAALDAERAELVTARAALARIFGAPAPETTSHPAPKAGRRARPPVAAVEPSTRDAAILDQLNQPMSSTALAQRLKTNAPALLHHLNRLRAAGKVTRTGSASATRWART